MYITEADLKKLIFEEIYKVLSTDTILSQNSNNVINDVVHFLIIWI